MKISPVPYVDTLAYASFRWSVIHSTVSDNVGKALRVLSPECLFQFCLNKICNLEKNVKVVYHFIEPSLWVRHKVLYVPLV